jgi:S1-C subfamily serine protease
MTSGRVRRAYLGIAGGPRPLPPRVRAELDMKSAVEVVSVVEGSPAERAGLRPEDLIVELDGTRTANVDDVQRLMVEELIDRPVEARVVREGRVVGLRLVPEEMGGG